MELSQIEKLCDILTQREMCRAGWRDREGGPPVLKGFPRLPEKILLKVIVYVLARVP